MTLEERAERIFASCFTKEELEFLKRHPEFIEARRKIGSMSETLRAVEIGEYLIKETWRSGSHEESVFTPRHL